MTHLFRLAALIGLLAAAGMPARAADDAAFVGMQIQGISAPVAQALGLAEAKGVLIRDVALGGPADVSGFRRGDLIVRFGGKEVATFEGLLVLVREVKAGAEVPVVVMRQGRNETLTLKTTAWPESWKLGHNAFATLPYLGVTLAALNQKTRESFDLRWGTTGVVVSLLDPDKEGAKVLRRGDVIVQVNQETVWLPDQVMAQVDRARAGGRTNLLLLVENQDGFRFSLLPVR